MADIAHDAGEDGFHEIQLSGKQLVFLFMVTTVVSVVIFLCGVLVGRGVRADRGGSQVAAATASPVVPAVERSLPPPAQTPRPADAPRPAGDALTYPDRLASEGASAEKLKKTPDDAAARRSPPPPANPVVKETPAAPVPVATQGAGARPGIWVVQATALRDRSAATALANRLASKGYPAFVLNPSAGSPAQVYRVQVGRYADRREAERISERLKNEEKFNPWISR